MSSDHKFSLSSLPGKQYIYILNKIKHYDSEIFQYIMTMIWYYYGYYHYLVDYAAGGLLIVNLVGSILFKKRYFISLLLQNYIEFYEVSKKPLNLTIKFRSHDEFFTKICILAIFSIKSN